MTRSLYSEEYLMSGCSIEYDAAYAVDNTMWTYVSAYTVSLMALMSGLLILYADKKDALLMSLYFILTGFGYMVGGASSQFAQTTNDWQYTGLRPLALAVTLCATACLMRSGLLYYFFSGSIFANIIWLVSNISILVTSIVLNSYLIGSIWMTVVYAGMAFVYMRQSSAEIKVGREWLVLKTFAMLVSAIGFIIQYILEHSCGASGYEECFAGCPLADPTAFNNTAIKNILIAVGVLSLAIAEIFLPSHDFWETEFDEDEEEEDEGYSYEDKNMYQGGNGDEASSFGDTFDREVSIAP